MIYDYVISKPPLDDYIAHFNPFHDPKNGQFASNGRASISSKSKKQQNQDEIKNREDKIISDASKLLDNALGSKEFKSWLQKNYKDKYFDSDGDDLANDLYRSELADKFLYDTNKTYKNLIDELGKANKQNIKIDGKTIKELNRNPEAKSQKIIDDINNNSEYKEALSKYSELSKKYSQEFNNKLKDPKVIKKAEEEYKKTRGTNKIDKKDPIYDYVLRDVAAGDYEDDPRYDKKVIAEATKAFKKDYGKDADPLNNKYYDYYIDDAASKLNWKPKRVKSETEKQFNKSVDDLIKVQNKVVNDYLGSYANQKIGKSTRTYSDVVNSMMLDDRMDKKQKK